MESISICVYFSDDIFSLCSFDIYIYMYDKTAHA